MNSEDKDNRLHRLEDLEPHIRSLARRHSKSVQEIEDLEQVGRLRAWQVYQKTPGLDTGYYLGAADFAMLDEIRRLNGRKGSYKSRVRIYPISQCLDNELTIDKLVTIEPEITSTEKVEFIKESLRNKFGRFHYHKIKNRKDFARKITRCLIEDVWKFDTEDIPKHVDYYLFRDSGLTRFLWTFYRNSPFRAVAEAYPGKYFAWEFKRVPNGFWKGEDGFRNAVDAVRWICQKYNISPQESCIRIGTSEFEKEGLGAMLHLHFRDSSFLALKTIFPDLNAWETKQVSNGFYKERGNRLLALESMLVSLGMPSFNVLLPEEIYDYNTRRIGKKEINGHGLRGLLSFHHNRIFDVFNSAYPGKTKPWFFKNHRYKNNEEFRETAAEAIRWLFDKYLEIPKNEIPKYATCKLFWQTGFSGILTTRALGLNSSTFQAVNLAYPGEFSKSDFSAYREIAEISELKEFRGSYGSIKR